ncbi:MAG: stage V sporulation protein AC [Clostridia bacterium]|nr:stage V sporulation protein AC [Clostridia bacterium]
MNKQQYDKVVKKHSPPSPTLTDTLKAFVVGGLICALGELLKTIYLPLFELEKNASALVSVTLVFAASLLTAVGVFDKIAKFAGAGTLVPITGFSNAMTSSAMEHKSEGAVLGVGAQMFAIAGPVISYGTISSIAAGLIYYFFLR